MVAASVNIYIDSYARLFQDHSRSTPFPGVLFQNINDPSTHYIDPKCTIVANLIFPDDTDTATECRENVDPTPSASASALPPNTNVFSKDHTLYLIDLMRHHLEESDGRPKTLKELNARLKTAKSSKKNLWKDTAEKMTSQFHESFCADRVARKWNTLIDGYKKVKDNMGQSGRGTIKFQFFAEMDDLMGGQHDVVFPVVGTSTGLSVRKPEVLAPATFAETASCSTNRTSATSPSPRPSQKRRRSDDVLEFLRQTEEESRRRHDELLAQMKSAQQGLESLMSRLIDKL